MGLGLGCYWGSEQKGLCDGANSLRLEREELINSPEAIVSYENPGGRTVGWSMEDTDAKGHIFFKLKI